MKKAKIKAKESRIRGSVTGVGFIESFKGKDVSFNVYTWNEHGENTGFYKSAYTLEKAEQYLQELVEKSKQKKDED